MNRRLWTYAAAQVLAVFLTFILLSAVTKSQAKGEAQVQRSTPQSCPSGPGVRLAAAGNKTIIMPPSLDDSSAAAYSHGVRVGDMLFLAGHTGSSSANTGIREKEPAITDVRLGPEFLKIRKEILGRDFPASALIGVSRLMPVDGLLEIQAIAVLPCRDTATR